MKLLSRVLLMLVFATPLAAHEGGRFTGQPIVLSKDSVGAVVDGIVQVINQVADAGVVRSGTHRRIRG